MSRSGDTEDTEDKFQLFTNTLTKYENDEISLPTAIGLLCGNIYPQQPIFMRWRQWLSKDNPLGFKQPTVQKLQQLEEKERRHTMIRLFHKRMIEALSKISEEDVIILFQHKKNGITSTNASFSDTNQPSTSSRRSRSSNNTSQNNNSNAQLDRTYDSMMLEDSKGYNYYMRKPSLKNTYVSDDQKPSQHQALEKGKFLPQHAAFLVKVAVEGIDWDDEVMFPYVCWPDEKGEIVQPAELLELKRKKQESQEYVPKRESSRLAGVMDDATLRAVKRRNVQYEQFSENVNIVNRKRTNAVVTPQVITSVKQETIPKKVHVKAQNNSLVESLQDVYDTNNSTCYTPDQEPDELFPLKEELPNDAIPASSLPDQTNMQYQQNNTNNTHAQNIHGQNNTHHNHMIYENPDSLSKVQHNQRLLESKHLEQLNQLSYIRSCEVVQTENIRQVERMMEITRKTFIALSVPQFTINPNDPAIQQSDAHHHPSTTNINNNNNSIDHNNTDEEMTLSPIPIANHLD